MATPPRSLVQIARLHPAQAIHAPVAGPSRLLPLCRLHSSSSKSGPLASDAYRSQHQSHSEQAQTATRSTPADLSKEDREALESMLRVDHAGEIAANTIYQAQAQVFGWKRDGKTREMMLDMWNSEKKHLRVARQLLVQHQVRPSALLPVWALAGRVLGGATALMGKEAAMACTEAVETVIGEHYDDQLVHLRSITSSPQAATDKSAPSPTSSESSDSGSKHPSLPLLADVIREFRDDELGHLDTAVEHDAQQAPAHALLSAVIGYGCKAAIAVAKRV
ncbi:putative ubiquinone biosynthesis monooxygenase [Tilletia horrida]|nr:putative ubiquinone biosynthesis monooxygenase [Tilletia horrida]